MQNFLFIKDGGKRVRMLISELQYVEAAHRYIKFVTANKVYTATGPLSELEQLLPANQFCRIHRSHIISLQHIRWFTHKSVIIGAKKLPIGKQYWDTLSKKVTIVCHTMPLTKKEINDLFKGPDQP